MKCSTPFEISARETNKRKELDSLDSGVFVVADAACELAGACDKSEKLNVLPSAFRMTVMTG